MNNTTSGRPINNNDLFSNIDYIRILQSILKHIWIVLLCTVVCAVGAFAYASYTNVPQYQSTAMLYVNNSSVTLGTSQVTISSGLSRSEVLDLYMVILKTRTTLERVIEKAELPYDYYQLSSMVSAASVNDTEIFKVVVTSHDADEAKLIADTIVEVLPDRVQSIINGSSVVIVDYAVKATSDTGNTIKKDTLIGAVVGLLASCGVIALFVILDTTIHDEDYLSSNYNYPILALVPDLYYSDGKYYKKYGKYGKYYKRKNYKYAGGVMTDERWK